MKVYTVNCGEHGEGSCVSGVFSTHEKAEIYVNECIKKYTKMWSDSKWEKSDKEDWWQDVNGCDYINIQEHEVQ